MGQMLLLHILLMLLSWMHDGLLENHPRYPSVVCPSTNHLHETISNTTKKPNHQLSAVKEPENSITWCTVCYVPLVSCSFVDAGDNKDQISSQYGSTGTIFPTPPSSQLNVFPPFFLAFAVVGDELIVGEGVGLLVGGLVVFSVFVPLVFFLDFNEVG